MVWKAQEVAGLILFERTLSWRHKSEAVGLIMEDESWSRLNQFMAASTDVVQDLEEKLIVDATTFSRMRWWSKPSCKARLDLFEGLFVDVVLINHLLGRRAEDSVFV